MAMNFLVGPSRRATGEACRLAHDVHPAMGERELMVASLRDRDAFMKEEVTWRAGRRLYVDWSETCSLERLSA